MVTIGQLCSQLKESNISDIAVLPCFYLFLMLLDPMQALFLESIRASTSIGGIENASPAIKLEIQAEMDRLAKQVQD